MYDPELLLLMIGFTIGSIFWLIVFETNNKHKPIHHRRNSPDKRSRMEEINSITKKLNTLWMSVPEQRLGQLICNIHYITKTGSLFVVDDGILENAIDMVSEVGFVPKKGK